MASSYHKCLRNCKDLWFYLLPTAAGSFLIPVLQFPSFHHKLMSMFIQSKQRVKESKSWHDLGWFFCHSPKGNLKELKHESSAVGFSCHCHNKYVCGRRKKIVGKGRPAAFLMLKKSLFVPNTLEKLFRNSSSMWKYDSCRAAKVSQSSGYPEVPVIQPKPL